MAITRYIGDRLVYDTDWWDTCCPLGHALRETQHLKDRPKPKQVYLIHFSDITIRRKLCCPYCYQHYLHGLPPNLAFPCLTKAVTVLRAALISTKLLEARHDN